VNWQFFIAAGNNSTFNIQKSKLKKSGLQKMQPDFFWQFQIFS